MRALASLGLCACDARFVVPSSGQHARSTSPPVDSSNAWGVTRWQIRGQVRARRWRLIGDQAVCLHNGPLSAQSLRWAAVFQGGPRARLDGASSLAAGGLTGYETERIRVSVPRGARVRRTPLFDIRQTRRWREDDLAPGGGVPRTKNAIASVRGALWAASDRQAQLLLTMPVQQGLTTAGHLAEALLPVRRAKRLTLAHRTVVDLAGGIRSVNELDLLEGCRARGLPEPDRQAVRRTPGGSYYLDCHWARFGVTLEVDGIHHTWVEHLVADALRHNEVALDRDVVLRLPVMGLRACPDAFFDQLEAALRRGGWRA